MIEPRGGTMAFAFSACAGRIDGLDIKLDHGVGFTSADSEDEARVIVMADLMAVRPAADGWGWYNVHLKRIDDLEWVGRLVPSQDAPMREGA